MFPEDTVSAIHRYSKGTPRLINTICENALVVAYARAAASVTPDVIDGIATDFRLEVQTLAAAETGLAPDELELREIARKLRALYTHVSQEPAREGEVLERVMKP